MLPVGLPTTFLPTNSAEHLVWQLLISPEKEMGARVTLPLFLFTATDLSSFYCIESNMMKTRICFSRLDLLPCVVLRVCSVATKCLKSATMAL